MEAEREPMTCKVCGRRENQLGVFKAWNQEITWRCMHHGKWVAYKYRTYDLATQALIAERLWGK